MRELEKQEVEHVSGGVGHQTLGPGGGSDPGNLNRADNRFISSGGQQTVRTAAALSGVTLAGAGRTATTRVIGGVTAWALSD